MTSRRIILFLGVTFVWSWGFWSLPVMLHRGVALPPGLADLAATGTPAAWGPMVGALVTALAAGGVRGVQDLLRRATRFRLGGRWWAIVLLTFPLLIGVAYLFGLATGDRPTPTEAMRQPLIIPIALGVILLTGGPLQEEFGWRGTLLDPLQARLGALGASVAVGATWGVWHIPLFLYPNDAAPFYSKPFWGLLVTTVLISVLFTWIWNNTGKSLVAMLLFHAMFNLSHWVLPVLESDNAGLLLFGLQAGLVAWVVGWYGAARLAQGE